MRKRNIILLAIIFLVNLLFATNAFAEKSTAIDLKPAKDNYIKLNSVKLIKFDDNNIEFSIKGQKERGTEPLHFGIQVDVQNKTYKTFNKQENKAVPDNVLPTEKRNNSTEEVSINSVDHLAAVSITTNDPVHIPCCETGLQLNWTVSGGTVTNESRSKWNWDGNPTLGGTHWYLSYNNYGNWYGGGDYTSTSAHGKHYNYDFQDDSLSTYAYHDIEITGYGDGDYDYDATWRHTGEYYYFLYGEIWVM